MIKGLRIVDFYACAKGGKAYVYAYLREKDHTPYYVGLSTNGYRPVDKKHCIKPPIDRRLIRVLRCNLTQKQAQVWEIYFIAKYGRKDLGTGILRNLSHGGEGNFGYLHHEETKLRIGQASRGRKQTPEWLEARISKIRGKNNGMYGRRHTAKAKEAMSKARRGVKRGPMPEETRKKISEAKAGKPVLVLRKPWTQDQRQAMSEYNVEWHRQAREVRANTRGVTVEELLKLEKKERNQRSYAKWKARQTA
jgi:hypothetical protein